LDDRVGSLREREKGVPPARILEIDCGTALVAVDGAVERRHRSGAAAKVSRVVSNAGVLDLDDVGAEIGKIKRANRTGKEPREVEDAEPSERTRVAGGAHRSTFVTAGRRRGCRGRACSRAQP